MTRQGPRKQRAHHIHKRLEEARKADDTKHENLMTSGRIASEVQNSSDINWLESMLACPELVILEKERPRVVERLNGTIVWLREVTSRTLGDHNGRFRIEYTNLWTTLRLIESGKHKSPTTEQKRAAHSKYVLKKMRYEETKTVRPAWMSDSSLLPKRPPVAAIDNEEASVKSRRTGG